MKVAPMFSVKENTYNEVTLPPLQFYSEENVNNAKIVLRGNCHTTLSPINHATNSVTG